jgi:hypothetical protein
MNCRINQVVVNRVITSGRSRHGNPAELLGAAVSWLLLLG